MEITKFDKETIKKFRMLFELAMEEIEEVMNVKVSIGNVRYDARQFTTKMSVTLVSEGEDPLEAEDKKSLDDYGTKYGLSGKDYDRTYTTSSGKVYRLKAIKPRSRKYPFIMESEDGSRYKMGVYIVEKLK